MRFLSFKQGLVSMTITWCKDAFYYVKSSMHRWVCYVIFYKRGRVFHQGSQTREVFNTKISGQLMFSEIGKPRARKNLSLGVCSTHVLGYPNMCVWISNHACLVLFFTGYQGASMWPTWDHPIGWLPHALLMSSRSGISAQLTGIPPFLM